MKSRLWLWLSLVGFMYILVPDAYLYFCVPYFCKGAVKTTYKVVRVGVQAVFDIFDLA